MKNRAALAFTLSLVLALQWSASAQVPEPRQSPVRPGGLPVFSPVMQSGSDHRAADFNKNYLPIIREIAENNLGEGKRLAEYELMQLESSKLFLKKRTTAPIRIYYITGVSGCQNSMGFAYNLAGATNPGNPFLVFPTTANLFYHPAKSVFLSEGDFVDIDYGGNGWQLDCFMIVNGGVGENYWRWWAQIPRNADRLQHIVAFAVPGTPFLMLGFDDAPGGGDRDFNDLVVVIDIGEENIGGLTDDVVLPN